MEQFKEEGKPGRVADSQRSRYVPVARNSCVFGVLSASQFQ